jgi:hypothetical protein
MASLPLYTIRTTGYENVPRSVRHSQTSGGLAQGRQCKVIVEFSKTLPENLMSRRAALLERIIKNTRRSVTAVHHSEEVTEYSLVGHMDE